MSGCGRGCVGSGWLIGLFVCLLMICATSFTLIEVPGPMLMISQVLRVVALMNAVMTSLMWTKSRLGLGSFIIIVSECMACLIIVGMRNFSDWPWP